MNAAFAMRLSRAQRGARQSMLVTLLATLFLAAVPQTRGQEVSSSRVVGPSEAGLPFKAVFTTTSTVTADPSSRCPELITDVRGSGLATQLGKFTTVQSSCLIPSQDPLVFQDGMFVFTAADGSTLRGRFGGRIVPTPTSSQDDQFLIEAPFTLVGGTGRFRGAKGGGSGSGLLSPSLGEANIVLDGNIQLPRR